MSQYTGVESIGYAEGDLDDVSVGDVELFRMERMDNGSFWIRLHRAGGKDIVFWLNSRGKIKGHHHFDSVIEQSTKEK